MELAGPWCTGFAATPPACGSLHVSTVERGCQVDPQWQFAKFNDYESFPIWFEINVHDNWLCILNNIITTCTFIITKDRWFPMKLQSNSIGKMKRPISENLDFSSWCKRMNPMNPPLAQRLRVLSSPQQEESHNRESKSAWWSRPSLEEWIWTANSFCQFFWTLFISTIARKVKAPNSKLLNFQKRALTLSRIHDRLSTAIWRIHANVN